MPKKIFKEEIIGNIIEDSIISNDFIKKNLSKKNLKVQPKLKFSKSNIVDPKTNDSTSIEPKVMEPFVRKPFEDIKLSLMTIMAYTNMEFDFKKIFETVDCIDIDHPMSDKKNPKPLLLKNIRVPEGSILHMAHAGQTKGLIHKYKKPILGNKKKFPNCTSMYISLGNSNPHLMIFRECIKISGCKNTAQSTRVIQLLLDKINECYTVKTSSKVQSPKVIFDIVMTNHDLKVGFQINRHMLNSIMYLPEYSQYLLISDFEPSSVSQVSIKLKLDEEPDVTYKSVIFNGPQLIIKDVKKNDLNTKIKKTDYFNRCTVTCHLSSVIKLSTRCNVSCPKFYDIIMSILENHQNDIRL